MISQTTEYALRAVVHLAYNPDTPQTHRQIAAATQVPPAYLSKVLQALARADVIRSMRGTHGGFALTETADRLSVYRVVDAVDPIPRIRTCPLQLTAHAHVLCPLHRKLDDAMSTVEQAFRDTTIGEIVREPAASRPLCSYLVPPCVQPG